MEKDLVWHTHQLNNIRYRFDTIKVLGRTPNHEDTIAQDTLSNAYDATCHAWKEIFGVPYSICGCTIEANEARKHSNSLLGKIFKTKSEKGADGPSNSVLQHPPGDGSSHATEHSTFPDMSGEVSRKRLKMTLKNRNNGSFDQKTISSGDHQEAFTEYQLGYYAYWGVSMPTPFG